MSSSGAVEGVLLIRAHSEPAWALPTSSPVKCGLAIIKGATLASTLKSPLTGTLFHPVPPELIHHLQAPVPSLDLFATCPVGTSSSSSSSARVAEDCIVGAIVFCPHESLLGGRLCASCGLDVSRLPDGESKCIRSFHTFRSIVPAVSAGAGTMHVPDGAPEGYRFAVVSAAFTKSLRAHAAASRRPLVQASGSTTASSGGIGAGRSTEPNSHTKVSTPSLPLKPAPGSASSTPSQPSRAGSSTLSALLDNIKQPISEGPATHPRAFASATYGAGMRSGLGKASPTSSSCGGASGGGGSGEWPGMRTYRVRHGMELSLSDNLAKKADASIMTKLRGSRRLSLVLDLDHTLVHATNDPRMVAVLSYPDLAAHVHVFTEGPYTYYLKIRPGLREFLTRMSSMYELQVDTAGTRAYAERVVSIMDPTGTLFGDRIVSRCDSTLRHKQSTAWLHRSLQDDSMVVIVDDTEEVWKGAQNLLVIDPYKFWKTDLEINNAAGKTVGDSGSAAGVGKAAPAATNGVTDASSPGATTSAATATVSVPTEVTPHLHTSPEPSSGEASDSSDSTISTAGVKRTRAEFEASSNSNGSGGDGNGSDSGSDGDVGLATHATISTLDATATAVNSGTIGSHDTISAATIVKPTAVSDSYSDSELSRLVSEPTHDYLADIENVLRWTHREYYRLWDASVAAGQPTPSTSAVIQAFMASVLQGCCLLFSGIFPLQIAPEQHLLYRRALQFGAGIADSFEPNCVATRAGKLLAGNGGTTVDGDTSIVTHLVARLPGTQKVFEAQEARTVRIVHVTWLQDCLRQYRRLPESGYPLASCEAYCSVPQQQRVTNYARFVDSASSASRELSAATSIAATRISFLDRTEGVASATDIGGVEHNGAAVASASAGASDMTYGGGLNDSDFDSSDAEL